MDKTLKNLYATTDPEQKIMILRMEMITPVSKIRGYVALMKKYYADEYIQPEKFKSYIDEISESADRLKSLLDELS
jgi:hypothetical protein